MKILDDATVAEVTRAVESVQLADLQRTPEWGTFSFSQGVVGLGIFAAARQRFLGCSSELFDATLERAVELFNGGGALPGLHSGLAGLGLFVAQNVEAPELLESIDEALRASLHHKMLVFSLREGLAGLAIYAAVRVRQGAGAALAQDLVAALARHAVTGPEGTTWVSDPSYARSRGVDVLGEPVHEFGMAHGQAGMLVGLASLAGAGVPGAAALVSPALDWTWAAAQPPPNRFGWVLFGDGGARGRFGLDDTTWCTGAPGVMRAAWLAARAIGHPGHSQRALHSARLLAETVVAGGRLGLQDHFDLCCGSSAVGHLFLRFFEETGEAPFRTAAVALLREAWREMPVEPPGSFQFGRPGMVTAVMTASTATPLPWDAVLALDVPH